MIEPNIPDGAQRVTIDVAVEVYLKGHQESFRCIGTFQFNRLHLDEENPLEHTMGIITHTLVESINDRRQPDIILSDQNANKFLVESDEIQAVSIMAPSMERFLQMLENE